MTNLQIKKELTKMKKELTKQEKIQLLATYGIAVWEEEKIEDFRRTLLNWYDKHKRILPWRDIQNPYYTWVSEIMLQQTQVVTVIPYYLRFIKTLPTIKDLAKAPETTLLKLWEGLGYYSRVRNMQTAAQQIMTNFNGQMPDNLKDISTLKGIGSYTAGAILSIAFNQAQPAVDGNVMRVMARLFEINLDIADPKNKKIFELLVSLLIDPNRPGDFNQALMDLGSDICSAKNPKPEISPIKDFNAAYLNNTMAIYPIKTKKQKQKDVFYTAYVIENEKGEFLFQQRENSGLLANLWTFPMLEHQTINHSAIEKTENNTNNIKIGKVTHTFTHLKWHIDIVLSSDLKQFEGKFIAPNHFKDYPMPTVQIKILKYLKK